MMKSTLPLPDLSRPPGGLNVHLYPSTLTHASRIDRITAAMENLALFDAIWIVGVWKPGLPEVVRCGRQRSIIRVKSWRPVATSQIVKALNMLVWSWMVLTRFRRYRVTCINCHSLPALPISVALKLITGAKLVYDTHELETETYYCRGLRKLVSKAVERVLIRFADEVCVVTQSIADWYRRVYRRKRVWLVRNVPATANPRASDRQWLRSIHDLPADALLFIYQGLISPERGCNKLLEAFTRSPSDRHLVLMGDGPGAELAKQCAASHANIHYQPAVPVTDVLNYTAGADVGVFLLPENCCLSYQYSLGNKFFEYLAAGLAVVVSDNPEMARIVRQHQCGWVYRGKHDDFSRFLGGLTRDEIAAKRANSRTTANVYDWPRETETLRKMYEALFDIRGNNTEVTVRAVA